MRKGKFCGHCFRSRLAESLCLFGFACAAWAGGGCLEIRNGYFWDPVISSYFIPRGIAYQIWNPPVGADQSFPQVEYDLLEFKKMYANSARCEFVWSQLETSEGVYDWSKPDFLVGKAEELGIKLFVIIGFQYPPSWFPKEWRGVNDRYLTSNIESNYVSDVVNYEHPEARRVYRDHIARVTERYKNSRAIGAWILGNEYAYFDLWEPPAKFPTRRFLGYDAISQASFKTNLIQVYQGDIAALNSNWGTGYANFESVVMPERYPPDHNNPAYHDLIEWRKRSIGDFVAQGARAAQIADPNHLKTYSMVGGIFNGNDANHTCEDAKTIVSRCVAAGAPLDFWSINNYAWASFGSELRSADYGIAKYQAQSGLPVMISETGHSSTEDSLGPGAAERQAKAIPSTMWESLLSGAIGVHLFHWNDRSQFVQGYFQRERGFGIVNQTRTIKTPVFENVLRMFRRMTDLKIENLLGGSMNPRPDVQFFWSTNADMVWPRANQENCMLWGALKRLGYQPAIMDDQQFERGEYTNAAALLLSRCFQMNPRHLDMVLSNVIPAGIHVHANADLPGQYDAYHRENPDWVARMDSIFGLGAGSAAAGFETSPTNGLPQYKTVSFRGAGVLDPISRAYADGVDSWKIWHGVKATAGTTVATHTGVNGSQPAMPALQIKTGGVGSGRSAINTFALGDAFGSRPVHLWDIRYEWLQAIYRSHFGMEPVIELSGSDPGYRYVIPDYRICRNGSVLVSLLNEYTNSASIMVSAPALLKDKVVENLTVGGILNSKSDGTVNLTLSGDDYVLLYAYDRVQGKDLSLVNPSPAKIWFDSAPTTVWPRGSGYDVSIGYDTQGADLNLFVSFELVRPPNRTYGQSANNVTVSGKGTNVVQVPIPDADPNDPAFVSSRDGANYVFHAWLEGEGRIISETYLPVRLVWGVRPSSALPTSLVPGRTYELVLEWQELPSYLAGDPTPLARAALWDSIHATAQSYNIVLDLMAEGKVIASDQFLTRSGTSSHKFSIHVPSDAKGPFTWSAYVQSATGLLSHDVEDSFEGRDRGAQYQDPGDGDPSIILADPTFIAPWSSFTYSFPNLDKVDLWQNQGVHLEGSDGSQSAFMVVTNPPNQLFSGFGITFVFTNGDWALPKKTDQWKDYVFSYDFQESHGYDCFLEMQVKNLDPDVTGKWIQFSKPYIAVSNQWDTVSASLEKFVPPPGLFGVFEPDKVHEIVVNVRMVSSNAQFVASFDNIRFQGPEILQAVGDTYAIYSSTNDLFGFTDIARAPTGDIRISWIGPGILQSADKIGEAWTDLPSAASPLVVTPGNSRKFFRLHRNE